MESERNSSVTLILSLDPSNPLYYDFRVENNDQWAFLEVIQNACVNGFLSEGDILICDNASVHDGADSSESISQILKHFGVELVFLPAYSPELNPCELVFSQVKQRIRNVRGEGFSSIFDHIILAFESVTLENILNYYTKCLFPKFTLPEFSK
jgi:transposase